MIVLGLGHFLEWSGISRRSKLVYFYVRDWPKKSIWQLAAPGCVFGSGSSSQAVTLDSTSKYSDQPPLSLFFFNLPRPCLLFPARHNEAGSSRLLWLQSRVCMKCNHWLFGQQGRTRDTSLPGSKRSCCRAQQDTAPRHHHALWSKPGPCQLERGRFEDAERSSTRLSLSVCLDGGITVVTQLLGLIRTDGGGRRGCVLFRCGSGERARERRGG